MEYFSTTSSASKRAADCVLVAILDADALGAGAADIDKASGGGLRRLLKTGDVSGKRGRLALLNGLDGVRA
ncbi:MAG: M17 family peptidase N-terminal domain-containing protein, partial [Woeseiaceae bacterium]|nr:M17 family peptidase N-terminal domain-containing protein [Woeseiaceae bacterium]